MAYRMIQVGTGGFGGWWCLHFLPPNVKDGLIEVVAAVDINPEALQNAQTHLGLRRDQCYTDIRRAFDENRADFCTVVVPPAFHERVVDLALEHGLHILSEKPIADTLLGAVRIAGKVRRAGKKMGVTMSHRFDQDKTTLRRELRLGEHGALDYLVCRFTCDCRRFASWGKFRHEIPDALMVEGAVHHLDILADLAGAPCDTIYAQTWTPPWGEFAGDAQGLVTLHCSNGVRALYEGAKTNAVGHGQARGRRGGGPPAPAAQMGQCLADREIRALAGRRRADGDERGGQPAVGGPGLCRHREQPQWAARARAGTAGAGEAGGRGQLTLHG